MWHNNGMKTLIGIVVVVAIVLWFALRGDRRRNARRRM